jgi:hypothetical protein
MEESVATAKFKVLVCTERFAQKANDRKGGVPFLGDQIALPDPLRFCNPLSAMCPKASVASVIFFLEETRAE